MPKWRTRDYYFPLTWKVDIEMDDSIFVQRTRKRTRSNFIMNGLFSELKLLEESILHSRIQKEKML